MEESNALFYSSIECFRDSRHENIADAVLIAKEINENIAGENMSKASMASILSRILTRENIERQLLEYEFANIKYDSVTSLKDLLRFSHSILLRYQGKVGGFDIEDSDWCSNQDSQRFKLLDDQVIIYNTIDSELENCDDINIFMTSIINHISKVNNTKYSVRYHIKDDLNSDVAWVIIVFEKRKN